MAAAESFARIISVSVQDVFDSSAENELYAYVEIANDTELAHSAQVVFRGYVRKAEKLVYEFLHEQVWILVQANDTKRHKVAVDVWLPRFPPSMEICNDLQVEYSVRATVDPWFLNNHIEKTFSVRRIAILKMPHVGCYQQRIKINKCVDHGGWYHKMPSPDHPSLLTNNAKVVAMKEVPVKAEKLSKCELNVPKELPVTMAMTLWNVLAVRYELLFQVKIEGHRRFVDFNIPVIIASEAVQGRETVASAEMKLFSRAQHVDDDTDDDDDQDSDIEEPTPQQRWQSSVEIDNVEVIAENDVQLRNAHAKVTFTINSIEPKALRSLRLLLQGEVRAGSAWYTFLRFKAHVSSDSRSNLSAGQHTVNISLPFKDSQYDTNILPPNLGDDIRYVCFVTTKPWQINDVAEERTILVDRNVDTFAKEKFKAPYVEVLGAYGIRMQQRAFQKGKHAIVTVVGDVRKVRLCLAQQRRIRLAGLKTDESYCHERVVAAVEYPDGKKFRPKQWSLRIPRHIPPSIEITYWNVLVLSYSLNVTLTMEDGHDHKHIIPVWIGCTEDKLPPPEPSERATHVEHSDGKLAQSPPKHTALDEAPEFEVVETEETMESPKWVDRYNDHTYS
ncbi:hypothetical protein ANCCEY_12801 [Ancylostoma ceylanicum]|uniref:Uncharacterized protein n=1 Tax=Ancylostoma ceylanicum TaxID=53326 RepID=A0A0D6LKD7_9BILA|nr:hypothetical protein ANCCEY_12801 [Ancylostoma ceylanicum]